MTAKSAKSTRKTLTFGSARTPSALEAARKSASLTRLGRFLYSTPTRIRMIAVTQDKKKSDQKNDTTDNLTKKMRNWCFPFLFEIEIPNVPVHERDCERRAQ